MRRDPKLTRGATLFLVFSCLSHTDTRAVLLFRFVVCFYSLGLPSHRLCGLCLRRQDLKSSKSVQVSYFETTSSRMHNSDRVPELQAPHRARFITRNPHIVRT